MAILGRAETGRSGGVLGSPGEDLFQQRHEVLHRKVVVGGVEAVLVVGGAEVDAAVVVGRLRVAVAGVAVAAQVVEVVVALEQPVVAHDPLRLLAHVGGDYGGRDAAVVVGGQHVADVVQQRGHHELVGLAVAQRPGGRLAAMALPVDLVAEGGALQQPHHREQVAHERLAAVALEDLAELGVVLDRPVGHSGPTDGEGACQRVSHVLHPLLLRAPQAARPLFKPTAGPQARP